MDDSQNWITHPAEAYERWQVTEATGADRRAFSTRSVVQHRAMFERFLRALLSARVHLANFGPEHLERFFYDVDNRCAPGTTTRVRYVKLIDRLCRHLVVIGIRQSNPAGAFIHQAAWPEDEPVPVFLPADADLQLQAYVSKVDGCTDVELRQRAVVALFMGAGLTANELRSIRVDELDLSLARPNVLIPKRGARAARRVTLPHFALAALTLWRCHQAGRLEELLFPSPRSGGAMTDEILGRIVREAMDANDLRLPDMSPRVLRNTFARRLLMDGHSNEDVTRLLGLSSQRTVTRLRTTMRVSNAVVPA